MRLMAVSALIALSLSSLPAFCQGHGWSIDSAHSSAAFRIKHMMVSSVSGSFHKVTGNIHYNGKNLKDASVEAVIDATTVSTGEAKRDEHLRSADFLAVDKYPTLKFTSKKIVPTKHGRFDIFGDLTLHGVTKQVVLHAEPLSQPVKGPDNKLRMGAEATATINRKDFGLSFDKLMDNGGALIDDNVNIQLDLEFTSS
jgi:polyisoprenoid-binding protein YceI